MSLYDVKGAQLGDRVDVYFDHCKPERNCEVIKFPVAVGDSWVLLRPNGTAVHVVLFSKMVVVKPVKEKEPAQEN